MKKINKYIKIVFVFISLIIISSCEDEDKTYFQNAIVFSGAYLNTLDNPNNEFSLSDVENSFFEVTLEPHDSTSNSSLFESVDVYISLNADLENEVFHTNLDASIFSVNENGYPEYKYISTANSVITTLNLDVSELSSSDLIYYRMVLKLTDGTTWTVGQISADLVGETFFQSPYHYDFSIVN